MTDAELAELEARWAIFDAATVDGLHGGETGQGYGELHRDDDCTPITTLEAIHLAEGPRDVALLLAEVRRLRGVLEEIYRGNGRRAWALSADALDDGGAAGRP